MWWVIQNNLYDEWNFENLIATLERLNLPHSQHRVVPFAGTLEPEPTLPDGANAIVMGSYSLARTAQKRSWQPGAWLDNLDFEIQREHWGDLMFNYDARVMFLGDVPMQREPFFLRPVTDTKSFTGKVFDWPEFDEWKQRLGALTKDDNPTVWFDTAVMLCTKKEIYNETRTWIVDGRVVTVSGYKVGTIKRYTPPEQVDERIARFAADCAQHWSPNRAYVLDVFDTPQGLKIGEINNLNSAGWYKADMQRLVTALEDMPLRIQ